MKLTLKLILICGLVAALTEAAEENTAGPSRIQCNKAYAPPGPKSNPTSHLCSAGVIQLHCKSCSVYGGGGAERKYAVGLDCQMDSDYNGPPKTRNTICPLGYQINPLQNGQKKPTWSCRSSATEQHVQCASVTIMACDGCTSK